MNTAAPAAAELERPEEPAADAKPAVRPEAARQQQLPKPPAGAALLTPRQLKRAWNCTSGVPYQEGSDLVGMRFGYHFWSWPGFLVQCLPLAAVCGFWSVTGQHLRTGTDTAFDITLPAAGAAVLCCLKILAWLPRFRRGSCLLLSPDGLRVLTRPFFWSRCREYPRQEIASVLLRFAPREEKPAYRPVLRLVSGREAEILRSGIRRDCARYTASLLSLALDLPVTGTAPLCMPGTEKRHLFSEGSGTEAPARRRDGVIERAAAVSGMMPPEGFRVYDADDAAFRAVLRKARLDSNPETAREGYAVRIRAPSPCAAVFTILAAAGAAVWYFADPGFILRDPAVFQRGLEIPQERALSLVCQLLLLGAAALGLFRVPRWLVNCRWFVFFPEVLHSFAAGCGIHDRRVYDRAEYCGRGAMISSGGRMVQFAGGPKASPTVLECFSCEEEAGWFAAVMKNWLSNV